MKRPANRRRCRTLWIATLLASAACSVLAAQPRAASDDGAGETGPPFYRLDVIVFRHAGGDSDRLQQSGPADFTGLMDPLLVARANRYADAAARSIFDALPIDASADGNDAYLESASTRLSPAPPPFAALGSMSAPMQRAFERLIESPDHEPVLARSWVQTAGPRRATPRLRLHDQAVVATRAPNRPIAPPWVPVDLRIPVAIAEDGRIRYSRLFRPRPPRLELFRLDGSARFRQRQFLHLDLDLVWQERRPEPAAPGPFSPARPADGAEPADGELEWIVHRMRQSRVVSPERLEYFDSSLFGVLVSVQRFERVVPEPEPEPGPIPEASDPSASTATPGRP